VKPAAARRWVRLYPRRWRERYGDELAAILEDLHPTRRPALDLLAGALDARLHPSLPNGGDPVNDIPPHARILSRLALAVLILPTAFLASVSANGFGNGAVHPAVGRFFALPGVEQATVLGPFVALALLAFATARLSVRIEGGALVSTMRLRATALQAVLLGAAALMAVAFVGYWITERF